jgi:hypothetical protein
MATLQNLQTGETIILMAQHIIGRHPASSNTVLLSPDASRVHATIAWDGEFWSLQDSSTNGTYVNGKRLSRGTAQRLNKDDEIKFANLNADGWNMLNVDAPKSLLIPEMPGLPPIVLEGIAVLPSEEAPEITLYMSPLGHWVCESESGISTLESGDRVGTDDSIWRFEEAMTCAETVQIEEQSIASASDIEIHFDVSQNEEHVAVKFKMADQIIDLGERNHHYLLLILARQRKADKQSGVSEPEQGWLEKEQLSQMLGLSETHINIQVYRFRKQIVKALPESLILPQIIERRTGEIRFVYDNIQISGGMQSPSTTDDPSQIAM